MSSDTTTPTSETDYSAPLMRICITFIILQTIFPALFITSRYLSKTLLTIEVLIFIPLAYISCIANCTNRIWLIHLSGIGKPHHPPENLTTIRKIGKADEITYTISMFMSRFAILCLYLKIFSSRKYRILTYLTGTIMLFSFIGAMVAVFMICRPFAYNWNPDIPGGKCGDLWAWYQYSGIMNLAFDVVLLGIPFPAILGLRLDIGAKIGLVLTFLSGTVGIIACIARTVLFFKFDATDPRDTVNMAILTIVEPGTCLFAACMPSLRSLKRRTPVLKDFSVSNCITAGLCKVGWLQTTYYSWLHRSGAPIDATQPVPKQEGSVVDETKV